MYLKNHIPLTSDITPGLFHHNQYPLIAFFSVALLMSFVLKADPEGSVTVSEIEYAGHSEKIPYEMQGSTAF